MADSPTIGLDLQATGANSGTWGVVTNGNLSILDNRNGGSLAVNVAGSSNVTLSEANVENAFLRLTGVLGASIDLIFPATRGGVYLIQNDSTGAFNITAKPSGGTGVTVPQGAMTLVFVNLTLGAAYKINVVSPTAANTWTALQTFSAGITGTGSIGALTVNNANWSGTDLAVTNGGTGASDAATAATNLGLGTGSAVAFSTVTLGAVSNQFITTASVIDLDSTTASSQVNARIFRNTNTSNTDATVGFYNGDGTLLSWATFARTSGSTLGSPTGGAKGAGTLSAAGGLYDNGSRVYYPGGTDVAVADGGTGQSTAAAGARALLNGLGTTKGNILWYDGSNWTVLAPP